MSTKIPTQLFKLPHYKGDGPDIAYTGDAGLDLRYAGKESFKVWGNGIYILPTGLKCAIPEGWCGLIMERSGLGTRGYTIHGRVIDSGYRGEIGVIMSQKQGTSIVRHNMLNDSQEESGRLHIKPGDKIAQMLIVPFNGNFVMVDELSETERGEKGFGSSDETKKET